MKKLFFSAVALLAISTSASAQTSSPKQDIARNVETFTSVVKQLQANYVDTIDMDDVVKTGINYMLARLDPYTEYFDTEEQQEFQDRNAGEYAGIGSYIALRDDYVWINGPREGSPAQKAGLRTGDKILEIDGESMKGKTTTDVSNRLRGNLGTSVKVKVLRPWVADSILTFNVVREKIQVPSVTYFGTVADGIGYIALGDFLEKSAGQFKDALTQLVEQDKIKGLIIDLRGNGGGYLQSAVEILGNFLPKGTEVLRTRGRSLLDEKTYKTTTKPYAPNLPLIVLTDNSTASASEITAGALQDLDRAVIVGNRSFGKGLVQSQFSMPRDGLMKITTAKYYIPSGRLIQAIDYRKRAIDGSAQRIADSLTNEFRTSAGRIVRDGGGITPDVKIEYPDFSRVTYNVVVDQWASDFANKYFAQNPETPDFDDIVMTDSIYADFKRFIDPDRFQYDKVCETAIKNLREMAKIEGYMTDEVDEQITRLESMLKHSLDMDLDNNRATISPYLIDEIVERYYYDRGAARSALRHDIDVTTAIDIISNPDEMARLLQPEAPKTKKK
ncbi:MAG: S41 family peptidase [Bacteroides sp.]|nr:S41 family peptidase [Bacteroides sp.]MCM1414282.1 S41 family peptidase [Bacteroides sp.]MCM1472410.1 S41 family peptidase [Bacteroides sp.]